MRAWKYLIGYVINEFLELENDPAVICASLRAHLPFVLLEPSVGICSPEKLANHLIRSAFNLVGSGEPMEVCNLFLHMLTGSAFKSRDVRRVAFGMFFKAARDGLMESPQFLEEIVKLIVRDGTGKSGTGEQGYAITRFLGHLHGALTMISCGSEFSSDLVVRVVKSLLKKHLPWLTGSHAALSLVEFIMGDCDGTQPAIGRQCLSMATFLPSLLPPAEMRIPPPGEFSREIAVQFLEKAHTMLMEGVIPMELIYCYIINLSNCFFRNIDIGQEALCYIRHGLIDEGQSRSWLLSEPVLDRITELVTVDRACQPE
jgi:hypothetical protein